jgi:hypothetical protein
MGLLLSGIATTLLVYIIQQKGRWNVQVWLLDALAGALLQIFNPILVIASKRLTDWENHRTLKDHESALIIKTAYSQFSHPMFRCSS